MNLTLERKCILANERELSASDTETVQYKCKEWTSLDVQPLGSRSFRMGVGSLQGLHCEPKTVQFSPLVADPSIPKYGLALLSSA